MLRDMYKKSLYNYIVSNGKKQYIYNTLYDSFVRLDGSIEQILEENNTEIIQALLRQGIIVNANNDELSKLKEICTCKLKHKKCYHFTITPTLSCNARCFYCYEAGTLAQTVNAKKAKDIINFIKHKAGNSKCISITWFGGEPLLACDVIEKITHELEQCYTIGASVLTNGSLLSVPNIKLLKRCHVNKIQLSIDGYSKCYEQRKAYADSKITFNSVIENIQHCISEEIHVALRLNFDRNNYASIIELIEFLGNTFYKSDFLSAYPAELFGNQIIEPYEENDLIVAMNHILQKLEEKNLLDIKGTVQKEIRGCACMAHDPYSLVIDPMGYLYHCEHDVGNPKLSIGTIYTGIQELDSKRNIIPLPDKNEKCNTCVFYPKCLGGCDATRRGNESPCGLAKYALIYYVDKCIQVKNNIKN